MASDDDSDESDQTEHGRRHVDNAGSKDAAGGDSPGLPRPNSQLSGRKLEFRHLFVSESDSVDTGGLKRGESSASRLDRVRSRDGEDSASEERMERRHRVSERISIKRRPSQVSVHEQRVYPQRPRRNGNTSSKEGRRGSKRSGRHSPASSSGTLQHTYCIDDLETRGRHRDPSTLTHTEHFKSQRNKNSVPLQPREFEGLTLPQSTEVGRPPPAEDRTDPLRPDEPSPASSDVTRAEDGTVDPCWKQQRANTSRFRAEGPNELRPVENSSRPDVFAGLDGRDKVQSLERIETSFGAVPAAFRERAGSLKSWRSWFEEVGKEEDEKDEYEGGQSEADEGEGVSQGDGTPFDGEDLDQAVLSEDGNEADEEDQDGDEKTVDDTASPNQDENISEDEMSWTERAPKDKDPNVHERDLRLVRAYATANGRLAFYAVAQIRLMRALTQIRQPTSRDQYQNAYECAIFGLDLAKLALETNAGQEDINSLFKIIAQAHYYAGLASHLAGPDGFERALEHLRLSLDYALDEDATGRTRAEQVINNILQYQQDPLSVDTGPDHQEEPPKSSRWAWIRGTVGSISSMASSFFRSPYENGVVPKGRRLDTQMLDGEVSPGQAGSLRSVSAVGGAVRSRSSANGSRQSLYIPPHSVSLGVSVGIGSGVFSVRCHTDSSDSDEEIEEAKPASRRMTLSTDGTGRSRTFVRPAPQRVKTAPSKLDSERSSSAKVGAVRSDSSRKHGSASAMLVAPHGSTRSETKSIQKTQAISPARFNARILRNSNHPEWRTKTAAIPTTITEEREVVTLEDAHGVRTVKKFSNYQFGKAQEPPGAASRVPKLHSPDFPPEWRFQPHDDQLAPNEERPDAQHTWPAKASKFDEKFPSTEEPEDYPQGFYEAGFQDAQYAKPIDKRSWQMEDFVLPVQRLGLGPDYVEEQQDEGSVENAVIRAEGEWQQKESMARKLVFPRLEQIFQELARETICVMLKTSTREEMFEYCNDDCHEGCRDGCRDPNHIHALLKRKAWEIMGAQNHLPPTPPAPRSPKAELVVVNISPISPQMPRTPGVPEANLAVANTSPTSPFETHPPHHLGRYSLAVANTSPREYIPVPVQTPQGSNLNNTIVSPQATTVPRSPKAKQAVVNNEPPQESINTPGNPEQTSSSDPSCAENRIIDHSVLLRVRSQQFEIVPQHFADSTHS